MRLPGCLTTAATLMTLLIGLAAPAGAECVGQNLLDTMPAAEREGLRARAGAVPYPAGNLWQATRDGQLLHLVGTYHLSDPRHAATMARLDPLIAGADTVLVEAGPEEETALMNHIARDPSVMMVTEGATLADTLPPEEWTQLMAAMRARGLPPFMAAKFRPWYVTVVLSIPPCAMEQATKEQGLDKLVIDTATRDGIPIGALEPYDTVFDIFGQMDEEEQLAMVRSTLATEGQSEDYHRTLADAYFAGESRLTWELMRDLALQMPGYTPEQVEAEFAAMEEALMNARNRKWIAVIEKAAAKGPAFVAFGALHLSGEQGVLNLLARDGWVLTRLDG